MKSYFDIQGDGGSDVVGQVTAQRRGVETALAGVRRLLAIGSGKGGVGKSTLTIALAQALLARGWRVAVLDADFNGPCQAHLAGLEAAPWVPGEDGLELPRRRDGLGVVSLGSLLAGGAPMGFDTVSSGDGHVWRATREFALLAQLLGAVRWGELDALLLDLPPGAERTVHYAEHLAAVAGRAPAFVMVTIPSDVARGVVARSLTALAATGAPLLGYVENMAGYYCHGCGEVRPLFPDAGTPLDAPRLGAVPFDPGLAALCDRGWPAGEHRLPALDAVDRVAAAVIQALEETP